MSREGTGHHDPASAEAPPRDADAPDDEPMGGDPPCWAHLFGEDPGLVAEDANPPDREE